MMNRIPRTICTYWRDYNNSVDNLTNYTSAILYKVSRPTEWGHGHIEYPRRYTHQLVRRSKAVRQGFYLNVEEYFIFNTVMNDWKIHFYFRLSKNVF